MITSTSMTAITIVAAANPTPFSCRHHHHHHHCWFWLIMNHRPSMIHLQSPLLDALGTSPASRIMALEASM